MPSKVPYQWRKPDKLLFTLPFLLEKNMTKWPPGFLSSGESMTQFPLRWRKYKEVLPYMSEGGLELYFHISAAPPPHHMQLAPIFIFSGPAPQTAGLTLNLAKTNLKCPLRASTKIVNEVGPSTLYRHWTSESFPRFPTASTEWDVFLPFSLTHIISIIQAWVNSF